MMEAYSVYSKSFSKTIACTIYRLITAYLLLRVKWDKHAEILMYLVDEACRTEFTGLAPGSIWMGSMDPWKVWNLGFKESKSILRGPSGVHSFFPLNSCRSLRNPLVCPDYSSPSEWLFLNDFIHLACFAACGNMACHLQRTVFGHDLPRKIQIIVIIRTVSVNAPKRKRKKKWAEIPPSRHWLANKINAWQVHLMKAELIIKMYSRDLPNKIQIIIVNFQSFWASHDQEILA